MKIRLSFLLVLFVIFSSCKILKKTTQSAQDEQVEQLTVQQEIIKEEEKIEEGRGEATAATAVTVRHESVRPVESGSSLYAFYVIIGSFSSFDNARRYNIELFEKGFTAEVLESESGLFRISVGGYNSESSARIRIAEIRQQHHEHRDVWLLVRR
jgi:cell division protein FtsN